MISVKVLADSVHKRDRLTTLECTYPRYIHAEVLTHRAFSRNAASSRAIPTSDLLERVKENPVIPLQFGKNQRGMSASDEFVGVELSSCRLWWLAARDAAVEEAIKLAEFGVHKQVVNRLLEPFLTITTIISATEWKNFFRLRISEHAQPEIYELAHQMREAIRLSTPEQKQLGEWHLPMLMDDDPECLTLRKKLSVARCARVSYLTHDGKRDHEEDVKLFNRLLQNGHASPFEHVAVAGAVGGRNFRGWTQFRYVVGL